MHLTLQKSTFVDALAQVTRVIEKRVTIPILSHVRLDARDGALHLRGTDLDLDIRMRCAAEIRKPGGHCVPAGTLYDIARKLPADADVELAMADETRMTVRAGRSRFTLPTLPVADFPDIAASEASHTFTLPARTLHDALDRTAFAISKEEARYYLNGTFLHAPDAGLRAVATDRHRLSRVTMEKPAGADGMPGIIIPHKTCGEMQKLAEKAEGDVTLAVNVRTITMTCGDVVLTSKLIDGIFPDYQRVIPIGNDKVAQVDADAFAAAIDRVATISSERGRAAAFAFGNGTLKLTVTNPDAGSAEEEIEADYDGAPLTIGFNSRYAADITTALGGDTLAIRMAEPGSPTIFTRTGDDTHLCVLMPMRV